MEQETREYIPLRRAHKHQWQMAAQWDSENLVLLCGCGATMEDDGFINEAQ